MKVSEKDRKILRELAKVYLEIGKSSEMLELKKLWKKHIACKGERPMVVIETGTFGKEVVTPLLQCEEEKTRFLEYIMREKIVNHTVFCDDTVVDDFFPVRGGSYFEAFGLEVGVDRAGENGDQGYHFHEQIQNLETDFVKLGKSRYGSNLSEVIKYADEIRDIFGDILPVKLAGGCLYSVPTQEIVHRMSMETMLFSMYDYPDLFKKMMDMLADDVVEYYRFMEKENLIMPTTDSEPVGQGTYAFTDELPSKGKLTSHDVWGYLDSQETVGISPEMFEEFIFPCYEKIANEYGMLSYGCCEPVDGIWEKCLSKLKNMRRVSISPWCDEQYMGERLANTNIVYHRKPSPNFLGVDRVLDEEAVKKSIQYTMRCAKNCTVEFTQRDVYTVHNDVNKVKRFVEIIRENAIYR